MQPYYAQAAGRRDTGQKAYDKWMAEVDPAFLRRINKTRREQKKPIFRPREGTVAKKPVTAYIRFVFRCGMSGA